jgi:hypothetical protein
MVSTISCSADEESPVQPETDAPMDLSAGGETFRDRVIHPWMFRAYMLAKMPVLGVTGAYLTEIDTRSAELALPFGWGTKNLYGRMFDSAVVAGAETTSMSLLVLHIRNQEAELSAEVAGLEVDVLESTTEDLEIVCDDGHRYADFVARASRDAPHTQQFRVDARTTTGRIVHRVTLEWRLQTDT